MRDDVNGKYPPLEPPEGTDVLDEDPQLRTIGRKWYFQGTVLTWKLWSFGWDYHSMSWQGIDELVICFGPFSWMYVRDNYAGDPPEE